MDRNAGVCCVCKRRGIGINIHHIDGNSANNEPANLAVLCVQEHDAHHRPRAYPALNHLDLAAEAISNHKSEWEQFVDEACTAQPRVLGIVNLYGTFDQIHAARLLFQWYDGKVVLERLYHLLNGPPDQWIESLIDEVKWVGPKIKLVVVDQPLAIDYCPCCGKSLPNIVNPDRAKMLTSLDWEERSFGSIYINPERASIGISISYADEPIVSATMHKCGTYLHLSAGAFDERIPIRRKPSVRTQATQLIMEFCASWKLGRILFGAGDPNNPDLINSLQLPRIWERA